MKTIIVVLVILIAFILCYVFLEKAEIKRLKKELDFIMSNDTNRILHTEFNSKELKEFEVLSICICRRFRSVKRK